MARPIRLTMEQKKQLLMEIFQKLSAVRMADSGLKIEQKFKLEGEHKATVQYSEKAWYKTIMLIDQNAEEVGWYGICRRDPEDRTVFRVEDIIVYPQKVTGATINPDPAEFAAWECGLDDETFNHMRIHVHSHVYMGVTPSTVDERFREDRLSQLKDNDFMIFQIMNKRGDISSAVYDFEDGIYYESNDVSTTVECENMEVWKQRIAIGRALMGFDLESIKETADLFAESGMKEFLNGAKTAVTTERVSYGSSSKWWNGKYNSGAHNGGYTGTGYGQRSLANASAGTASSKVYDEDDDDGYEYDIHDVSPETEVYLRSTYGDAAFEKYGKRLVTDPFFCEDDGYDYAGHSLK